jgi:integrase
MIEKWEPRGRKSAEHVPVADTLNLYIRDVAPGHARPWQTASRVECLADFFGDKFVSQITGSLCRQYVKQRGSESSAARELNDLKAALLHYHREGYMRDRVTVWTPKRAPPRTRWLTRKEAALLIRAAWRRPAMRHVARFALVALYTGARAGRICGAALGRSSERGYVDLETGHFIPQPGRIESKKRQPAIPLPKRLLAHMRRWHNNGQRYVVEWRGQPVARMDHGFRDAAKDAGLHDVSAHILKHTCITWLLQRGVPIWQVAGYTGTSAQTIGRVYGHHSVDHMAGVLAAIDRPGGEVRQRNVNESPEPNVNQRARTSSKMLDKQRTSG